MNKLARQIYRISAKAYMEAINVYEKELPEELQSNETFDFFVLCLQKTCAEDLYKWGIDAIDGEEENNKMFMFETSYRVCLYKNDYMLPIRFETFQAADDYIFKNNIHGYITIVEE